MEYKLAKEKELVHAGVLALMLAKEDVFLQELAVQIQNYLNNKAFERMEQ